MRLMNVFLFALGASFRFAYTKKQSWDGCLVNQKVIFQETLHLHQSVQILRLLDPTVETIAPSLYPKLKGVGQQPLGDRPTLFYSVSNNRAGCTLSLERAAFLLNRLREKCSLCIIINGLPQDQSRALQLSSMLKGSSNVRVTESFVDFLTLLNSVDVVFAGEGGVCHLASALEKPVVALFGGTIFARWHPMNERAICFESQTGHVDAICEIEIVRALKSIIDAKSSINGGA